MVMCLFVCLSLYVYHCGNTILIGKTLITCLLFKGPLVLRHSGEAHGLRFKVIYSDCCNL